MEVRIRTVNIKLNHGCLLITSDLVQSLTFPFPVDVHPKISPESAYYNYCLFRTLLVGYLVFNEQSLTDQCVCRSVDLKSKHHI